MGRLVNNLHITMLSGRRLWGTQFGLKRSPTGAHQRGPSRQGRARHFAACRLPGRRSVGTTRMASPEIH